MRKSSTHLPGNRILTCEVLTKGNALVKGYSELQVDQDGDAVAVQWV